MASTVEQTLVLVKPDGVQRGLVGPIISRLEAKGLRIVGLKMLRMDDKMAKAHYAVHEGKPFFKGLVEFITSGPIVAVVFEGPRAIELVRHEMGKTDPIEAAPGTIRSDWGLDKGMNLVHGSDSAANAQHEIEHFFSRSEIMSYKRDIDRWIVEG